VKMCVECEMKGSGLGGGPCGDLERGCGGGLSGTWVGRGMLWVVMDGGR